jgi:chemotaxis protein MotB
MRAIPKPKPKQNNGNGWIVTFADLMSLLLTFFILLLSFSNMDLEKYEAMSKAMTVSFGVSALTGGNKLGGNIIFAEQPPVPPPSNIEEQPDLEKEFEDFDEIELLEDPKEDSVDVQQIDPNIDKLTENLVEALVAEILSNSLSVSYDEEKVVVRFSDASAFTSGSEELKDDMLPIVEKIETVLSECQGDIIVSGYTDNLPVNSRRFRSNWDLSAARAVSVVHQLIFNNKIDPNRVIAAGRAETNPLAKNDTAENRSKNRRVEINIYKPECKQTDWVF